MPRRLPSSRRQFAEYLRRLAVRIKNPDKNAEQRADNPAAPGASESRPGKQPRHKRPFWQLIRQFWQLIRGQRWSLGFSLATLSVATLLRLVPPAATKIAIDYILPGKPLPEWMQRGWPMTESPTRRLTALAIGVVILSLVATIVHLWGRWHATRAVKRVQMSVRRKVFEHAVRLPLFRVYQLKSGGAASLIREDAGGVAELIFSLIYNPWRAVIQLLGSLVVLAWVDWRLLAGSIVLLPAVFLTHRTWIRRIRPVHRDIRKQRQEIDSHTTEAFGGMRVVRAFGRDHAEGERFTLGNHLMGRQELLAWRWSRMVEVAWDAIIPLASAAVLMYGGTQVLRGHLSLGDLTMFLFYVVMLLEPLAVLAESATALQSSLAGLDRVLDVLDEPHEFADQVEKRRLERDQVAGEISLSQVSFTYPGQAEAVLNEVSLTAPAGTTVALVGASGAGKTTLTNLVARFYDPQSGAVTLDGRDLRTIHLADYRRLLGIVEQDVFLFDGTVAENIGYARPQASDEEIIAAATAAYADEFIRALPQGYETFIGERGVRLSGGQRQRIAIARALLSDPKILILDEATSNLDSESERAIQQSLAQLVRGRTCFVIAHRLSTIQHADQIVVLEQGRILDLGTHEELLQRCAKYQAMVHMQVIPWSEREPGPDALQYDPITPGDGGAY